MVKDYGEQLLSFEGLGITNLPLRRIAFYVGNWPIYWYGIILAAAFLVASLYLLKRVKRFGLDADRVLDVLLVGIIGGVIGARLYYVAFSGESYSGIIDIISPRNGGLAVYGGIIGGVLAGMLMCKIRRVKLLPMLDLTAGALILGQAIGRWANFINIEAFGSNTTLPWGMSSRSIEIYLENYIKQPFAVGLGINPLQPVHPTFFYESLWCLLGFVLIFLLTKHRRFDGQLSLVYLIWYGVGRALIEGLRTDSLLLGSIRVSQLLAMLCVLVAGITLLVVLSRIRRESDPEYLRLYVETDEGKAVLAGEFYKKNEAAKAEEEGSEDIAEEAAEESPEDEAAEESIGDEVAEEAETEDE